ncbi:recombinase family protein [Streptosporangium sp. NPDC023963]|uniref:recombinase family protein n=1 Tax=Streptosporangium sp. NPDC023963 TaxID=3155608 RepID=UPI003430EE5B
MSMLWTNAPYASVTLGYTGHRWAIYVRISRDRIGAGLGVQRQETEIREMIHRLDPDAVIVDVYDDNDVSASNTRKRRKNYERMLADIEAGVVTAVGCWHLDRVTRRNLELEHLCTYAEKLGTLFSAVHGDIDLRTSTGRMSARMFAAASRREVEHKAERQKSANRQRALRGESWYGGMRTYGYEKDGKTVVESEAEVLREVAKRILKRQSLRSIIADLDARNVRTANGRSWQAVTLRRTLQNPKLAGWRTLNGEKVAKGTWDAIIDEETQAKLVALFSDPLRNTGGGGSLSVRKYLLSGGLLVCGMPGCGRPLQSQPSNSGARGYVCRKNPPSGGCGRIRIAAEALEEEVAARVMARFASPLVARRLHSSMSAQSEEQILDQIKEHEENIASLASDWVTKRISKEAFQAADRTTQHEITKLRAQINQANRLSTLPEGLGPRELAQWWADVPLERRRDLVAAVLDHISVGPTTRVGFRGLDLARLNWVWRD